MTDAKPDGTPDGSPTSNGPSYDMVERLAALAAPNDGSASTVVGDIAASPTLAAQGHHRRDDVPAPTARYSFGAVFAEGGLGAIRRAYDHVLERTVAAKEVRFLHPDSANADRFKREALLTAKLEHPSIIPVHDYGSYTTGEPFYCMKLVDGQALDALVRERPTLADRLALVPHVLGVADALAYAHDKRIIHRDLKPSNVLIGAFGETVVIDWGLAKELDRDDTANEHSAPAATQPTDELTRTGEVVGTLAFMPPEQAEGRPLDARADVYAIGAMLYFVLSGCVPYQDMSRLAIFSEPPPDLAERVEGLPADLLAIVRKAMARDPGARYLTAKDLAADLRRFQAGRLVAARLYSTLDLLAHFARRYRRQIIGSLVSALIIVSVLVYSYLKTLEQNLEIAKQRDLAVANSELAAAAQMHAERLSTDALRTTRALYLDSGRRLLFSDQNPQAGLLPLYAAYELDRDDTATQILLAQAVRSVDALGPTLPLRVAGRRGLEYDAVGKRLLVIGAHETGVIVMDTDSGLTRVELALDEDPIENAVFVPAGDRIVALTSSGRLVSFDADTGATYTAHTIPRQPLKQSPLKPLELVGVLSEGLAALADGNSLLTVNPVTGQVVTLSTSIGEHWWLKYRFLNGADVFAEYHQVKAGSYTGISQMLRWRSGSANALASYTPKRNVSFSQDIVTHGERVFFLEYKANGPIVLDGGRLIEWNTNRGTIRAFAPCPDPSPGLASTYSDDTMALSEDGQHLFLLSKHQISRWSTRTLSCDLVGEPMERPYRQIHVRPSNRGIILRGDGAEIAKVSHDLMFLESFVAHAKPIDKLALRPDGRQVATMPLEGEVRVWDLDDSPIVQQISFNDGIQSGSDSAISDYERARSALRRSCSLISDDPATTADVDTFFTPAMHSDGKQFRLESPRNGDAKTIRIFGGCDIWGGNTRRLYYSLYSRSKGLMAVPRVALPERKVVLADWHKPSREVGGWQGTLLQLPALDPVGFFTQEFWGDEITGDMQRSWGSGSFSRADWTVTVSSDGLSGGVSAGSLDARYYVVQTSAGKVTVHEAISGEPIRTLRTEQRVHRIGITGGGCRMPNFSPDWNRFVTSQPDGGIDVWDAETFANVDTLHGHKEPVCGSLFDPGSMYLVTYDLYNSGEAYLWDLEATGRGVRLETPGVRVARFSSNGDLLATGDTDGGVRLWAVNTGQQIAELRADGMKDIIRLAFSDDSQRIFGLDESGRVTEWLIRREVRSPETLRALIEARSPFTFVDGRVVPR